MEEREMIAVSYVEDGFVCGSEHKVFTMFSLEFGLLNDDVPYWDADNVEMNPTGENAGIIYCELTDWGRDQVYRSHTVCSTKESTFDIEFAGLALRRVLDMAKYPRSVEKLLFDRLREQLDEKPVTKYKLV